MIDTGTTVAEEIEKDVADYYLHTTVLLQHGIHCLPEREADEAQAGKYGNYC
jgi:hypothetical protein